MISFALAVIAAAPCASSSKAVAPLSSAGHSVEFIDRGQHYVLGGDTDGVEIRGAAASHALPDPIPVVQPPHPVSARRDDQRDVFSDWHRSMHHNPFRVKGAGAVELTFVKPEIVSVGLEYGFEVRIAVIPAAVELRGGEPKNVAGKHCRTPLIALPASRADDEALHESEVIAEYMRDFEGHESRARRGKIVEQRANGLVDDQWSVQVLSDFQILARCAEQEEAILM
ncbi:hypothetical protein SAMN07250955_10876 [Arboricoccus pini]|uniref:Uncharacterized protein n=1 Tax=Arboricoccus pini TaxID=1963835 RepID=A0A212RFQ1_9PROT|nr:hypothetical protein [Arboricoccus pini]SNB71196.1 hypothetical protein SAMN07250955_10876 [Arboricoccus pini]